MAGNIKGITIEFRGDTTKLDKALRQINNETRHIDKELKQVDKALKFNPTSVELWRQKQQLLSQKINETKEKLTLLKNEQARMDAAGVDKNSEEYRKLQREIIETESKVKTFEAQLRKVGNVKLRAASEQFKEMGNKLTAAGQAMRGLSMAAAAVTASIGALTVKSGKWADDMNTMSKVYSIGTKDLQMYSAAAGLVDVSVETIAKSHTKLEKQMLSASKGTGSSAEAFEKLGVSVTNADGSLRKGDDVWQDTIKALGSMENETERDALAMQLLGKSAAELNPLIEDGGETYKQVAETMQKYGLDFVDQDTLDQANQFNDALDTMKLVGMTAFQQLGTQLAAYLAPAMQKVVDLVGKLAKWFSNLSPRTQAIIAGIAAFVAVLAPLLLGLGKLSFAISSIISLFSTVGPLIAGLSGPIGIAIAVIGALIAVGVLLYKNWDTIVAKLNALKARMVQIFNSIKASVTAIWNSIKSKIQSTVASVVSTVTSKFNALKSRVSSTWNSIKGAITRPINAAVSTVRSAIAKLKSIVNGASLRLPRIKLPHFSITGKFSLVPPSTPKVSVSWYKTGGIFDSPTIAGIGEAGPEAVVPLDMLWNKLDNIAEASSQSSGSPVINIYAQPTQSPKDIAREVEKVLVNLQKQRNMAYGGI